MKLAYISSSIIPSRFANSIHVMKMCQAFAKKGYDVLLIAPGRKDFSLSNEVEDVFEYYGVEKNFEIVVMPWLKIPGRGYFYGLKAALEAKRRGYKLVYGRNLAGCYFSALINLKVIFEAHQPVVDSGQLSSFLFSKMIRKKAFKHLVVISSALQQYYLSNYKVEANKVIVAHDGADPVLITAEAASNIQDEYKGCIHVGYVGHLHRGRGIDLIINMAEQCSWAAFHIIGGSEVDIKYWNSKAKSNVAFHGYLPHPQAELYRLSVDVLLSPYQSSVFLYDGKSDTADWMSPLKIFEYMAAAKPIICSDLPVLREVLEDGIDALLCPPADINCWVEALQRLRDDQSLRRKLGQAAYAKFINHYTWGKRAEKVLSGLK